MLDPSDTPKFKYFSLLSGENIQELYLRGYKIVKGETKWQLTFPVDLQRPSLRIVALNALEGYAFSYSFLRPPPWLEMRHRPPFWFPPEGALYSQGEPYERKR